MALTITVEQSSAILAQEMQRGMQKLAPTWSDEEWQSVSTLGRDSIWGSPWVNSIHENWQVPGQEILNAPTRLERIRALGG